MRQFLAAFASLAVIFSTGQAAGVERAPPKRHVQPAAAAHVEASHRMKSRQDVSGKRSISATADFRADELIPDICKGCSS